MAQALRPAEFIRVADEKEVSSPVELSRAIMV